MKFSTLIPNYPLHMCTCSKISVFSQIFIISATAVQLSLKFGTFSFKNVQNILRELKFDNVCNRSISFLPHYARHTRLKMRVGYENEIKI